MAGNGLHFTKACMKCAEQKPIDQFAASPLGADGLTQYCHTCRGSDAPIDRTLEFRLVTADRVYCLAAAAVLNKDTGFIEEMLGRITLDDPEMRNLVVRLVAMMSTVTLQWLMEEAYGG
jgi:hypothetical protein